MHQFEIFCLKDLVVYEIAYNICASFYLICHEILPKLIHQLDLYNLHEILSNFNKNIEIGIIKKKYFKLSIHFI